MSRKDASGKELERLVTSLESVLADTNAKIERSSRKLLDRDTGRPREHDVLIEWEHGHHRIITAIECRDRSRPVGVPDVEAFADKCAATGVHAGVIVSASGFRASAKKKAEARAITCMELSEVGQFDWIASGAVFIGYRRRFGHMDVRIMFKDLQPESIGTVIDTVGNELTDAQIVQTIANAIPHPDDPEIEIGKVIPLKLNVRTQNWKMRDLNGNIWDIDHIRAETTVTADKTISPIQSMIYKGGGKEYAVASANAEIGDKTGKFVLVKNEDESTSLFITFD